MRKYFKKKIAILSIASMLALSGCGGPNVGVPGMDSTTEATTDAVNNNDNSGTASSTNNNTNSPNQGNSSLTSNTRKSIKYSGDIIKVKKTDEVAIKVEFNPYDEGVDLYENFEVYQDKTCRQKDTNITHEWDEKTSSIIIKPSSNGNGLVHNYSTSNTDIKDLKGNYMAGSQEQSWGNFDQLYINIKVDTKTGKALDESLITVLSIEHDIPKSPQVTYASTEDGRAKITWEKVDGADEYLICYIETLDGFGLQNSIVIARTKDCEWIGEVDKDQSPSGKFNIENVYSMNSLFCSKVISDDDKLGSGMATSSDSSNDYKYDDKYNRYYCVLAINKEKSSGLSNMISANDYSHLLPFSSAFNTNNERFGKVYNDIMDLPTTMAVTMCDGTIAEKVIDYDFNNVVYQGKTAYIRAVATNTLLDESVTVKVDDKSSFESKFSEIVERQDKLKKKGGVIGPDITIDDESDNNEQKPDETTEATTESKPDETTEATTEAKPDETTEATTESNSNATDIDSSGIYANSDLALYLAQNMLAGNTDIDVSAFNEKVDSQAVFDAMLEASYQNPLILGLKSANMNTKDYILHVNYYYDVDTANKMREELKTEVANVAKKIFTDGMSDYEKDIAINQYLCDSAKYDDAALESAKATNFKNVDSKFNDSFNAYGILCKKVGVCASYAASYKLLADACGLECVVVTGNLAGLGPHAWNKVKINGNWCIVDSTNNDNEIFPNALLNLSDATSYSALVQDERFVNDSNVSDYMANTDENEYYKVNGMLYNKSEIVDKMVEQLSTNSKAILRTDYNLTNDEASALMQEIAVKAGKNYEGCTWLGVLHIKEK